MTFFNVLAAAAFLSALTALATVCSTREWAYLPSVSVGVLLVAKDVIYTSWHAEHSGEIRYSLRLMILDLVGLSLITAGFVVITPDGNIFNAKIGDERLWWLYWVFLAGYQSCVIFWIKISQLPYFGRGVWVHYVSIVLFVLSSLSVRYLVWPILVSVIALLWILASLYMLRDLWVPGRYIDTRFEDIDSVYSIQNICYDPHYQESRGAFYRMLRIEGVFSKIYRIRGDAVGYLFAYPCPDSYIGALNNFDVDGSLSGAPNCMFVHDVATVRKGRGIGSDLVGMIKMEAVSRDIHAMALVAVQESRPFWEKQGFVVEETPCTDVEWAEKGYLPGDRYMVCRVHSPSGKTGSGC